LAFEVYSAEGRLNFIQYVDGRTESLNYNVLGTLASVALASGRRIEFTYSATGEVEKAEVPARFPGAATTVSYGYERRLAQLLTSRSIDGEGRGYLYEDANSPAQTALPAYLGVVTLQPSWPLSFPFGSPPGYCVGCVQAPSGDSRLSSLSALTAPRSPYSLTGIIDEKGDRTSTYTYDAQGRAISTERAGGVGKYQINYASPTTVQITDPLNTVRTRIYQTINGVVRPIEETQPTGSGSGACSRTGNFDSGGNPSSRLDFNGNKTCYVYDAARAVEVKRVEGLAPTADCATALTSPPAGAQVTSTEWHPNWQLPTRVAEPKKITTSIYNGQGATCAPAGTLVDGSPITVMCSRSEQATTDATGAAGFGATTTGTPRTWNYTYTTYGRVVTATDPNNRTTTYAYHPDNDPDLGKRGNLATLTNAQNYTTQFPAYDLRGLPTQIIDANGLVVANTYNHRLQLMRQQTGNEVMVLSYDPVGQLQTAQLPDGASLTYSYDAAHRLTGIQDHKGNRITYTLNPMGTRIGEEARDAGGTLVKNIARVVDALNRVEQVNGSSR